MDLERAIQIIKAVTSFNEQEIEFDKGFLKLFDDVDIEFIEDETKIVIRTRIK